MNRLARTVTVASALSLVLLLSNCSSFDPTDVLDNIFASTKKPLPGERKALFPSGTPGVSQGLPAEWIKGYQPPPPEAVQDTPAAPDRPKPKPKVAAKPPANPSSSPAAATPAPSRTSATQSSQWPDPPPTRQSAAPANAGQTAWPDPPPPRAVTR